MKILHTADWHLGIKIGKRSRIEEDILGKAGSVAGEHYDRARDLSAYVPFRPGGGRLCAAQNGFRIPKVSHARKRECPHGIIFPGNGV